MRPRPAVEPCCRQDDSRSLTQDRNRNSNRSRNPNSNRRFCRRRHASRSSPESIEGSPDSSSALPITMNPRHPRHPLRWNLPFMEEGLELLGKSCVPQAHRGWRFGKHVTDLATRSTLFILLGIVLSVIVTPVSAVQIPAENCLSSSYLAERPAKLQWDPIYVDAVFDAEKPNHRLVVTVWGNVTGSQNRGQLPPPGDPYWTDPSQTNGKIIDFEGEGNRTTLEARINFLSYLRFQDFRGFCNESMVNGTCPLGPMFGNVRIPDGLPSFNLSHELSSSYAFTSLWTNFFLISGDASGSTIGCISAVVTPDLGDIAPILKFLPLVVLLVTGFAVPLAGIFSPWGTTDIFHWSSNYGRDTDLLRLVTPGFGDCLQYIQFIALSGALSLEYPGFFRPVVSQVGWSSLMFSESFVSKAPPWQSVVDGIYVTKPNSTYGLEKQGQLIGMSEPEDIWPGMMVWLCVMIASIIVLIQVGFAAQWFYRKIKKIPEEDLREKNIPFVVGSIVRIVFNYMMIPIVALSSFQLVIATKSPAYSVALAALTLVLVMIFATWLLYTIISTKPKLALFDDLPTLLRYGSLYNTYSDSVASFALIPVLLNFVRGIAIGAVQPSGVAQVVLLAICEVIQILMTFAIRPFHPATSMNVYQFLFAFLRLAVIMLMIAFAPSLGVTEGPKGWIGYTILTIHAFVLVLGFFLSSFQTIVEVVARMLGAGGDDVTGLTRGGLSKIFGMRQLSRRTNHLKGNRVSQLSGATTMLDVDKAGYVMPSGRVRSSSAASLGGIMASNRQRSSSAIDSIDMYSTMYRNVDSASSYMPGTPGEASTFSFLTTLGAMRHAPPSLPLEASDPYYRPPRRRRDTAGEVALVGGAQQGPLAVELNPTEPAEVAAELGQSVTPAPQPGASGSLFPASRPDYSTREVDFYYGVRGPALKSDGPGRKLGTGPADPTGPVATAAGWFRGFFGGKTKDKGKGFEVVRSSRMPPSMMARNGGADSPPEGVHVAMGNVRHGPIDSDDDEPQVKRPLRKGGDLLTDNGDPQSDPDEPDSPVVDRLPRGRLSEVVEAKMRFRASQSRTGEREPHLSLDLEGLRRQSSSDDIFHDAPELPRKSSKRQSVITTHTDASYADTSSRPPASREGYLPQMTGAKNGESSLLPPLPFNRQGSDRRPSSKSSLVFPEDVSDDHPKDDERPVSYGSVPQQRINRFDPEGNDSFDLMGTYAEVVDENRTMRRK